MTPHLSRVDTLVHAVAGDALTPTQALAVLRKWGMTPDRDALADAVATVQLRDTFLMRNGDPVTYTGIDFVPGVSVWDTAVDMCEDALAEALRRLAVPAAAERAS